MAYNRYNFLKKVVAVQNIVLEYKKRGCTQKWIYDNIIKKDIRFKISYSTFNNYLSISAKQQLRKLENERAERKDK